MPTESDVAAMTDARRGGAISLASGSLTLQIALRYLRSTRRDAFVSFLSAAASCGLGLGVAALILALAALAGFQGALRQEILARTPEIELTLAPGEDPLALVGEIERMGGLEAQALVRGRGWLMAKGGARPVEIVAFEGKLPTLFPGVKQRREGLYIGSALAEQWALEPGDAIEIASARPTLTPLGPQPRVRRIDLAGTFETGRTEYQDRVAMPWREGVSLLGLGGVQVLVGSGDLDRVDETVQRLTPVMPPGTRVRTWRDLNKALLFALRLEKSLMFLGVFLIVVVASLALVSSLLLILAGKRSEVGMLRAMGASPGAVRRVFLWLAGLLVGAGAVGGVVLGSLLAFTLDRWRLLRLPDQVYFMEYVPFRIQPADLGWILVASLALAAVCSGWAAGRAAKLDPVEALRR